MVQSYRRHCHLSKNIASHIGGVKSVEVRNRSIFYKRAASHLIRRIDGLSIWFGINPPAIDASDMLLHISDTPGTLYPYLRRALRRLRPAYIVHTGDFADDIKLERRRGLLGAYKKKIKEFVSILEEGKYGAILVAGNHDHAPTLLSEISCDTVQLWTSPGRFSIGQFIFCAGHSSESVAGSDAQYCLFGHNMDRRSGEDEHGKMFLNGLEAMYLIHLQSGEVTAIPYPPGTEKARLQKRRAGI